jgi:signal peptide peptidase SppA
MYIQSDEVWAGTYASLEDAERALAAISAATDMHAASRNDDEEEQPTLLTKVGNVGVIPVKGPLINADIPDRWASMFGVTTYPGIRRAAIEALTDDTITDIVLDVASGGGAVSGVVETAELLAKINDEHKPIYAYGDSMVASAAYWLAASAQKIKVSKATTVGSIGVISTHMEYSKQLKDEGVNATVFRAGKYKALGQPVEPLTDAAREQIQARLDATYTIFVEHVAARRGVDYSAADQRMGQGKEFFGQAAVAVGLVDGVGSFDDLLGSLQQQQVTTVRFNPREPMKPKATLTEAQLAALEEGADLATLAAAVTAAENQEQEEQATAATDAANEQIESAVNEAEDAAEGEQFAAQSQNDLVAFLREELASVRKEVTDLSVKLAAETEKREATEAVVKPMEDLVRTSVNRLRVALGEAKADLAHMSGDALLAEHSRLSGLFAEKFKAGGVAAVAPVTTASAAVANPVRAAQIRSVKLKK